MKTVKPTNPRKTFTDSDRNAVLKLSDAGLSVEEIVSITGISSASVYSIKQVYKACIDKDWSTLQRLSCSYRATVDWAMRITGTDKVFLETFPKEDEPEAPVVEPASAVVPEPVVTREEFLALYDAVQVMRDTLIDLCNLLR